jgi:DNA-directed RNA polymerase sigma subunit (sigma70/sigma32)
MRRVAKELVQNNQGFIELDDLISEGNLGLVPALQLFDPKSARFSTYARFWIHNRKSDHIRHQSWVIRIPHTAYKNVLCVPNILADVTPERRSLLTTSLLEELAELAQLSVKAVQRALLWIDTRIVFLGIPGGGSGPSTLIDFVSTESGSSGYLVGRSRIQQRNPPRHRVPAVTK